MSHYLRKFWKQNSLVVFFLLLTSALQVGANLVLMRAFQGVVSLDLQQFIRWILLLLAVWFALLWLNCLEEYLEARAIRSMNNSVRQDVAATLLGKTYTEYHEMATGEYLSWFTNDISQIENMAWKPFFRCIQAVFTIIFSIVALVSLHWSLLVASLATTLIMLFVPQLFNKRMEALGKVSAEEQAKATGKIKDLLSGYDILRAFSREIRFSRGTKESSDQIEFPKFRLSYVKSIISAGAGCINVICQMLLNVLIGFLSIRGIILQGALLGGGNLCAGLSNGLGTAAQIILSVSSSKPFFDKIKIYVENQASSDAATMQAFQTGIHFDNVSFAYDKKPVLDHVSFQFDRGGKYALTGPSGCGKSTVLKLLLGWLKNDSGRIRIDDVDVSTYTPEQLQQQMSYIEQNVFLFDSTIRDNITLGKNSRKSKCRKPCAKVPWRTISCRCLTDWIRSSARREAASPVDRDNVLPLPAHSFISVRFF